MREFLDCSYRHVGPKTIENLPKQTNRFERDMGQLALEIVPLMLELEARAWAEVHGFGLVEVFRGQRCVDATMTDAKHVFGRLFCFTPGEGSAAICERAEGLSFNLDYAKELAFRFRRKNYGQETLNDKTGGQFAEGSVSIRGFAFALDRVCRRATAEVDIFRKFVDLGSGRGNGVIAAHALFPFRECVGIELVPQYANSGWERAKSYIESENFYKSKGWAQDLDPSSMFIQGDIFEEDWSDASVVFCNAATCSKDLIRDLAYQALKLRKGAIFMLMSISKVFPPEAELLKAFDQRSDACLVSWVDEPVGFWVYQRL